MFSHFYMSFKLPFSVIKIFNEARRNVPSIVYIPNIDRWWKLVSETVRAILTNQLTQLDPQIPILFLATSDNVYPKLSPQVSDRNIRSLNSLPKILHPFLGGY